MPRTSLYSNDDRNDRCRVCGGTGQIMDPKNPQKIKICYRCGGSGRKVSTGVKSSTVKQKTKKNKKKEKKEWKKSKKKKI